MISIRPWRNYFAFAFIPHMCLAINRKLVSFVNFVCVCEIVVHSVSRGPRGFTCVLEDPAHLHRCICVCAPCVVQWMRMSSSRAGIALQKLSLAPSRRLSPKNPQTTRTSNRSVVQSVVMKVSWPAHMLWCSYLSCTEPAYIAPNFASLKTTRYLVCVVVYHSCTRVHLCGRRQRRRRTRGRPGARFQREQSV